MAKLSTGSKTVTTAGTRERLVAVASNLSAKALTIVAKSGNAGKVYVGNDGVGSSNAPELFAGDQFRIASDEPFNLADVYLDVSVDGEGVEYCAVS